ncbi:MAG TPA: hypothetical protein VFA55_02075 [Candidatus Kapabacteria bacterium]|nr:hypothetical protein [Candidatus Kapabacteria bacterium]
MLLSVLLISLLAVLARHGVVMHPDSDGYIQGDITRSALYPSLIHMFLFLSGTHGLLLLIIFQFLLGYVAITKTVNTLQNVFEFQDYLRWFVVPILLIPYVGGLLGNVILTEGIAYPIFMLGMCSLLSGIRYKRGKDFLMYLVYVTLLVLTRRQFLFLYVVFVVLVIWLYLTKAQMRKGVLILGFVASLLASTFLEKSYHLAMNQRFEAAPFGGMHFAIAQLYLSSPQDSVCFNDALQRSVFVETRHDIEQDKLIPDEDEIFNPFAYSLSFDKILYGHLLPILGKHNSLDPVLNDQMLTSMGLTLMEHNWKRFLHLYANNVIFYFGGYYFCALVGVLFLFSFYRSISSPFEFITAASFFVLLTAIGNVTATCLFIFLQKRYSMYTDAFVILLIMIVLDRGFQNWKKNTPALPEG